MITIDPAIETLAEEARQKGYQADEMHAEGTLCLRLCGQVASRERIEADFPTRNLDFTESLGGYLMIDFN